MTCAHSENQGQRPVGSKDRVKQAAVPRWAGRGYRPLLIVARPQGGERKAENESGQP